MFPIIAYPLLLSAGVGALWLVDRNKNLQNAAPPPPKPEPPPSPNPLPPPPLPPGPSTLPSDPNALIALATDLVRQAGTNPRVIDVAQIGVLSAALRGIGQDQLAASVEAVGPIACGSQGKPTNCWQIPVTGAPAMGTGMGAPAVTPGAIPPLPANLPALLPAPAGSAQAGYQATITAARLSLASVPLDRLQRFAHEAAGSGLPAEAAWLDALAQQRAALGSTPGQDALRAKYQQMKASPPKDLAEADAFVRTLGAAGLVVEAQDLAATVERLKVLRAAGLPADAGPPNPNASTLPVELAQRVALLLNDPNADPVKIDTLVSTIQMNFPGGFLTQIAQLQKRADELRQQGR